jgi:hypothetical protein
MSMISEILASYARNIRVPDTHRATTLGASDIGQCARKTFYLKRGGKRDPGHIDGWGAALRGSVLEQAFWLPALRARFFDKLKFAGNEQRQFKSGFISATPDALLTDVPSDILKPLVPDIRSDCLLLECKSIDPRIKLDAPKPEHKYQAIVQLGVVREVTEFQPRYAVISYVDASFWDTVTEFVVEFDADVYASAKARAAKVFTASAASELPPEGFIAGGKECELCPFTKACGIEQRAVPPLSSASADPQFIAEMRDLAVAHKARQGEVEAATVKVREVQHEIRERLRAKGLRRVAGDDFSVTWTPVKGRQGFDVKALSAAATAAGIDVSKFETTGEPSDRLDVRVREARF